ncbi:chemotaxis protein CheW [Agarivorans sp. TSD2052]|uniref:chemotaxis protein CheW n=1 Tax=Agarivorans sp. TSD2052 TaxID=2937286 RepID=UPI00200D9D06|nr:chemotaxis protein CheW [Agarivorans sp. TSD2052]UPW20032.1 chemotaxis protein CheW [Agarivorans sp. TSD2052]
MNSDKLMEQALGSYFDSLLNEESAPVIKPSEATVERPSLVAEPQVKPLATLFAEAETRVAAMSDAPPILLPIQELPEQQVEPTMVEPTVAEPVVLDTVEAVVASPQAETLQQTEPELVEQPQAAEWQNIETDDEFQALFFEVAGVTFGVPLTELGGIHRISEVSPLFGKPEWFAGIMIEREQKLSVVDTAKWVMPNQPFDPEYKYVVMLGESPWGLSCEKLFGTERLTRDDVKWRKVPGQRRWLAGMVKKKMCALVHVEELLAMLSQGVNIEGH